MKCVRSAVIFGIIAVFLMPSIAVAQTRGELAEEVALALRLEADVTGIFYYNDWQTIDKSKRGAIGAVVESGVFRPSGVCFGASDEVVAGDIDVLRRGLDRYILLSDDKEKIFGEVYNKASGEVTIRWDYGVAGGISNEMVIKGDMPYLGSMGVLGKIYDAAIGERIYICRGRGGENVMAWRRQESGDEIVQVRRGGLYLWEQEQQTFLIKAPEGFRFGYFLATGDRYDDSLAAVGAKVYDGGREIGRGEINGGFLDRRVNYLLGRDVRNNQMKVLHLEFE